VRRIAGELLAGRGVLRSARYLGMSGRASFLPVLDGQDGTLSARPDVARTGEVAAGGRRGGGRAPAAEIPAVPGIAGAPGKVE